MKRLIAVATLCVFLWYGGVMVYPLLPAVVKTPHVKAVFKKTRISSGLGVLFDREETFMRRYVSYRFYQDGKWQKEQQLLEPLFNDFKNRGNFAALRHCRLDMHLVVNVHSNSKRFGIDGMLKKQGWARLKDHMLYRHTGPVKPDSLELTYTVKKHDADTLQTLLTFKSKL